MPDGGTIARGLGSAAARAITGGVVSSVYVPAPGIMSAEITIDSNTEELRAENKVIATATDAPVGGGSFTLGRMGFAFLVVVNGGVVETLGTGSAEISRHTMSGDPVTEEFTLDLQTDGLDVAGSAYRIILPVTKATPASESLDQQAWNNPTFDIQFRANADNELIIREQFETMVPIGTAYPA